MVPSGAYTRQEITGARFVDRYRLAGRIGGAFRTFSTTDVAFIDLNARTSIAVARTALAEVYRSPPKRDSRF